MTYANLIRFCFGLIAAIIIANITGIVSISWLFLVLPFAVIYWSYMVSLCITTIIRLLVAPYFYFHVNFKTPKVPFDLYFNAVLYKFLMMTRSKNVK